MMDVKMPQSPLNSMLVDASLVDSGSIDMPADERPPVLFRRAVSSLVITGYLMMTMGQSYASSVVPFNGDVELDRTKFVQTIVDADEKNDDEATDSTGHSPGSTPEKVHPEPLSGGGGDVKDDHQHPFSSRVAPAPTDIMTPEEEETLKADIVTYIKDKTRTNITYRDMALTAGGLALAGMFIYFYGAEGARKAWIQGTLNTIVTAKEGYEWLRIDPTYEDWFDGSISFQNYNMPIALSPYILYRCQELMKRLFPTAVESKLKQRFSTPVEAVLGAGVMAAAISVAFQVAFDFYKGSIKDYQKYTQTMTPFLFAFIFMDMWLRYDDLKTWAFKMVGIKKFDTAGIDVKRAAVTRSLHKKEGDINKQLRSHDEHLYKQLDERNRLLQEQGQLKPLMDTLLNDGNVWQLPIENEAVSALERGQSHVIDLKQLTTRPKMPKFGYAVGLTLGALIWYFKFSSSRYSLNALSQVSFSKDKLDQVGDAAVFDINVAANEAFLDGTESIWRNAMRDVNGTIILNQPALDNWFNRCRKSAEVKEIVDDPDYGKLTYISFTRCEGVGREVLWGVTDLENDLLPEMAAATWNFMNGWYGDAAGVKNENNDDAYLVDIPDTDVKSSVNGFSIGLGVVSATAIALLTAKTGYEFVDRVKNSFVPNPSHILRGKHNRWVNGAVMAFALPESALYTLTTGVGAWRSMWDMDMNRTLLWVIAGGVMAAAIANVYGEFDDYYTRFYYDFMYPYGVLPITAVSHATQNVINQRKVESVLTDIHETYKNDPTARALKAMDDYNEFSALIARAKPAVIYVIERQMPQKKRGGIMYVPTDSNQVASGY